MKGKKKGAEAAAIFFTVSVFWALRYGLDGGFFFSLVGGVIAYVLAGIIIDKGSKKT